MQQKLEVMARVCLAERKLDVGGKLLCQKKKKMTGMTSPSHFHKCDSLQEQTPCKCDGWLKNRDVQQIVSVKYLFERP